MVGQSRRVGSSPADGLWGGPDTGGGAAEYTLMDREEAKRTNRERRRARCAEEQGARTNLGGGGKEGTKIISDGKHRIF